MINLAVINVKSVVKKLIKTTCILLVIFILIKSINIFIEGRYVSNIISKFSLDTEEIIQSTISISKYINKSEVKKEKGLQKILISELTIFRTEEELMEAENQEEIIEFEENKTEEDNQKKQEIKEQEKTENAIPDNSEIATTTLPTKIIQTNNKTDTFTDTYGSVKIKNESSYTLTQEMLLPNVEFTNKKDIIIYHTHTCESYTPTEKNTYQASGNFRTTDLNYSIARVGTELTNLLKQNNLNPIHDSTYHDYPAYSGSYTRALTTIKNILKKNPNTQLVIDLHRDALGSNSAYAPSVQIGDEIAAQLMFVIGTDGGGLEHKDWLYNFKLALRIQEKANEMYPGLFKPIILRNSRYNQHVTKGACIIEVGATGNTLEQCNTSMKYLSNVIKEVMK